MLGAFGQFGCPKLFFAVFDCIGLCLSSPKEVLDVQNETLLVRESLLIDLKNREHKPNLIHKQSLFIYICGTIKRDIFNEPPAP